MSCEQLLPRRKRAVLGFSMALGAFLSSARFERALRGFLRYEFSDDGRGELEPYICLNIVERNFVR